MFTPKIKYIWIVNFLLFVGVVYLGIEQAERGAKISILEKNLEASTVDKREISENIFKFDNESMFYDKALDLSYSKPTNIIYIDTIDTVLGLK